MARRLTQHKNGGNGGVNIFAGKKEKVMEITLTVSRQAVYKEVAQTTDYTGKKMDSDPKAYDRVTTTDQDEEELVRFWNECRAAVAQSLVRLVQSESMSGDADTYTLVLNVSDTALLPSMQLSLFSYFVQAITARWYVYANKEEAASFGKRAAELLEDVRRKAFYKKKPVRPIYND